MKRTVLLAALLVAIACTMAISTPKPLYAIMCCDNGGYTTAQYWVMLPTCAEAQTAYRAQAKPEADAFCGSSFAVCAFSIPACYASGSQWVVDGIATFGCKETCEIIP
jgi:hypothetical protein